ncbi:MAG: hypothetical protein FWG94_06900 [Oscillospiraceae bacterium]|nr:hypothetical protein [Oscillospiraceae bacterium]
MHEDDIRKDAEYEDDDLGEEIAEEQNRQQEQIIETGAVTPTKGKFVIHCLTIVGHIVIIDNAPSLCGSYRRSAEASGAISKKKFCEKQIIML